METNNLVEMGIDGEKYHDAWHSECRYIGWDELKSAKSIKAERVRLVSDEDHPVWDVSYVYLLVDGQKCCMTSFPYPIIKKRSCGKTINQQLVEMCMRDNLFIRNLCESVSCSSD